MHPQTARDYYAYRGLGGTAREALLEALCLGEDPPCADAAEGKPGRELA